MENGTVQPDLLRMIGFMGICVGIAWAIQILGFSTEGTVVGRLLWVIAAAALSGAGVGLIVTAGSLGGQQAAEARA
jgi:hypothetical protein